MASVAGYKPIPIHTREPKAERRYGPGEPPAGFLTQKTTADEWIAYWALAKIFSDPDEAHVRQGPFFGGLEWAYQEFASSIGLSGKIAIDFLIYLPGELIGIRVQSERFHVFGGPEVNAYDTAQFQELSRYITMRDIYSQDFIEDASGESAIRVIIEALGGRVRLPAAARSRRSKIGRR